LKGAETRTSILEGNEQLIVEFIESLGVLSPSRIRKYRYTLGRISKRVGPFESVTIPDLKDYIREVNSSDYEQWTKRDYRLFTKKFFVWLRGKEFVEWIKLGHVKSTVGPEDILTQDELIRLKNACTQLRDKALIETLYETACRPQEFLGLKKGNIVFDDKIARVHVEKGKTGPRSILVVNATPLLANWIANHPLKSKDAPLWVDLSPNTRYEPLRWIGLRRLVQRIAKSANLDKDIYPYLFRHTRLTHLAKFMTEASLNVIAGWEEGSAMPRTYVHLSGKDVEDTLLAAYGIVPKGDVILAKPPITCARCETLCESSQETCHKCGMVLTVEAAMKIQEQDEGKDKEMMMLIDRITSRLDRLESSKETDPSE